MSAITKLYREIPEVKGCRTGCSDCCGPVPMGASEAALVKSIMRPEPFADIHVTPTRSGCLDCAYSTHAGCSIYASRPFMCRLFGAVADEPMLACPHGAKTERPLSKAAAASLAARYDALIRRPA